MRGIIGKPTFGENHKNQVILLCESTVVGEWWQYHKKTVKTASIPIRHKIDEK